MDSLTSPGTEGARGPLAPVQPQQPNAADQQLEELFARVQKQIESTQPEETVEEPAESKPDFAPFEEVPAVAEPEEVAPVEEERGPAADTDDSDAFVPRRPNSLRESGLSSDDVEKLVCKYLLARGSGTGRAMSAHFGLPFVIVESSLRALKNELVLGYKNTAAAGDYEYALTDLGRERARRFATVCSYFGAAPVPLKDYIDSVKNQSLVHHHVRVENLEHAFDDLLIDKRMLDRLGPAINSGKGMFLYGSAGNGKTSIAERVTRCFGTEIWVPRAIGVEGVIIRMFDPAIHQEVDSVDGSILGDDAKDRRWVRIRRPTVVVGGELTMAQLEVQFNPETGISEAPMQMKSNCGILVIDDFGRQRMPVDELLNRWIVPLEKRYDFLNLMSGKKIQVPFDQLVIFSTNLEPKDLVDEAFLRRIPYKIEALDPSPEAFRKICQMVAPGLGIEFNEESIDQLMEKHYHGTGRPMRCCHPRDLLLQVRNYCSYRNLPLTLTDEALDFAIDNYFAVM